MHAADAAAFTGLSAPFAGVQAVAGVAGVSRNAAYRMFASSAKAARNFSCDAAAAAAPPVSTALRADGGPPPCPARVGPGVRLLLGVHSAPDGAGAARRDGVRATWLRWAEVGRSVHACFVVGRDVPAGSVAALEAEAARHGDVVWLDGTRDGRGPFVTIIKLYAWYRHVAAMLGQGGGGGVRHVAKVDDDTFVHVPVMLAELDAMRCVPKLYYGRFAYAGYNARTFLKCGYDESSRGGAYRRYGCWRASAPSGARKPHGAAHPPFPWTSGALMLTSAGLVRRLAASAAVGDFARRAALEHHTDEDVALGFWLSRIHLAAGGGLRAAHAAAGTASGGAPAERIAYVYTHLFNLGCFRKSWLYKPPRRDAVAVHFVKNAGGMAYVWRVLQGGAPPNATACRLATNDWRL